MISYIFFAMGAFLIGIGLYVWIGKKVDLIHGDDVSKIKQEDVSVYSRLTGIGVLLVAFAAIAYGVLKLFPQIPVYYQWIAVLVLGGAGAFVMFFSRRKYFNK